MSYWTAWVSFVFVDYTKPPMRPVILRRFFFLETKCQRHCHGWPMGTIRFTRYVPVGLTVLLMFSRHSNYGILTQVVQTLTGLCLEILCVSASS